MYELDQKLIEKIDEFFPICKEIADYMTDHPETGIDNRLAADKVTTTLAEQGYEITKPYGGLYSAFLAVRKDRLADQGPRAVLMSETDALPEVGHACGHSVSCAISLLATLALNAAYPDLPIRMDLMGTPGEEYPGGKCFLVKEGCFDGYEYAGMVHLNHTSSPDVPFMACADDYVTFHGKTAHASIAPEQGLNALNAARIFMDAMDLWRQHLPRYTQHHSIVVNGGALPSVVPDKIELNYYWRAQTVKDLKILMDRAHEAMQGAAMCTGCTVDWHQQYETYLDLFQNPLSRSTITEIFDAMEMPYELNDIPSGTSDAGNVDQIIPVFHPLMAATGGKRIPLHDREFQTFMKTEHGYNALRNGAILLASIALRMAREPELLAEIQRTHKEYREKNR